MFVVHSKPALSPTLAQRSTGDHLPTVARIGSHLLSIIVPTICLHTATSYANPRYQAYVGQETIEVQNLGSGGSSNCGSIVPEPVPQYHAGQDVEYIFTNGGVVDITKNGTYYVDVVCYAPMPIDAIMYAYGSSNDDTLNDSDSIGMTVYDGARFYQVLRAGYSQDFVIYVSNESALDRGWTKMMVSQFITKYENGDYGSYGQASTFGVLSPKIGADEIRGGEGNDSLQTSGGNDNLYGESGSDIITDLGEDLDYSKLVGDNDVDPTWNAATLFGGPGDDIFYVRDSKDKIVEYPGEGFDIAFCAYNYDATYPDWIMGKGGYKFTYSTDIEVIAGSCGQLPPNFMGRYFPNLWWQPYEVQSLRGKGTSLSDAISYYESSLIFDAGPADDLVVTGPGADNIAGSTGNDIIMTGAGNDTANGGTGNDLIIGGSGEGNDTYIGGKGLDTVKYTSAKANITINLSATTNQAYSTDLADGAKIGTDQLAQIENVIAGNFDDQITGSKSANQINGEDGNDIIRGEAGKDTLVGGKGADILFGGKATDKFVYTDVADSGVTPETADTIADFTVKGEKIDLSAIDASTAIDGNNAFLFNGGAPIGTSSEGEISVEKFDNPETANDYTMVYIDTDADTGPEASIRLNGLLDLSIKNFVL